MRSFIGILCLLVTSFMAFAQTYSEVTGLSFPQVSHSHLAWADFDNDQDLDLLIWTFTATTFLKYRVPKASCLLIMNGPLFSEKRFKNVL